jgi:hypothetical protein
LGQSETSGESSGTLVEIDGLSDVASLESLDQCGDCGVEFLFRDSRRSLHPDNAVDDRGLNGFAAPGAIDDLDRKGRA